LADHLELVLRPQGQEGRQREDAVVRLARLDKCLGGTAIEAEAISDQAPALQQPSLASPMGARSVSSLLGCDASPR
jgi:hypothetical protein